VFTIFVYERAVDGGINTLRMPCDEAPTGQSGEAGDGAGTGQPPKSIRETRHARLAITRPRFCPLGGSLFVIAFASGGDGIFF
jgi:hypothetical protein